MEIDHFKTINDQYGRITCDSVLHTIAIALTSQKRAYDSVGRWGGEEFLIVLPGVQLHIHPASLIDLLRQADEDLLRRNGRGETASGSPVKAP